MKHLDRNIEIYFASILLASFSILTMLQVIMRYVFNNPLSWSEELARYMFVWFVYISGSYAVKYRRHVRLGFIVDKMPKPINLYSQLLAFLSWLSFLIFLDIYSFKVITLLIDSKQKSPATNIPMYILYFSILIGAILMTIRVIQHVVNKVVEIRDYHRVKE